MPHIYDATKSDLLDLFKDLVVQLKACAKEEEKCEEARSKWRSYTMGADVDDEREGHLYRRWTYLQEVVNEERAKGDDILTAINTLARKEADV